MAQWDFGNVKTMLEMSWIRYLVEMARIDSIITCLRNQRAIIGLEGLREPLDIVFMDIFLDIHIYVDHQTFILVKALLFQSINRCYTWHYLPCDDASNRGWLFDSCFVMVVHIDIYFRLDLPRPYYLNLVLVIRHDIINQFVI